MTSPRLNLQHTTVRNISKTIRDCRPSLAMMHIFAIIYLGLSRNGEDSFSKLLIPHPDPNPVHHRGGSRMAILLLVKSSQSEQ